MRLPGMWLIAMAMTVGTGMGACGTSSPGDAVDANDAGLAPDAKDATAPEGDASGAADGGPCANAAAVVAKSVADGEEPTATVSNASGTANGLNGPFDLAKVVDGFAVHEVFNGPGGGSCTAETCIDLLLTLYPNACAYSAHATQKVNEDVVEIHLRSKTAITLVTPFPAGQIVYQTNRGSNPRAGVCASQDTLVGPLPEPDAGASASGITLTALDDQHIAGSFDFTPFGGDPLRATFDLPFCKPGAPASSEQLCCVE